MKRTSQMLMVALVALALWTASSSTANAQMVYYPPAPVAIAPVTSYYAPPPVVTSYYAPPAPVVASYYAPPPVVTSYYAPPAVTTYRYGPLGRLRSVSGYYAAPPVVVRRYGYYW